MFTGIVTHCVRVLTVVPRDQTTALTIAWTDGPLTVGESIAVDGVCLTVISQDAVGFTVEMGAETLAVTTLGALQVGTDVHLERALAVGDRLGGHMVSGHVDGVGTVRTRRSLGESEEFWFNTPEALRKYIAVKGSVTVQGISLTVNAIDEEGFSVLLIPHTLRVTTLGRVREGSSVNLEVDVVARYVARLLGQ